MRFTRAVAERAEDAGSTVVTGAGAPRWSRRPRESASSAHAARSQPARSYSRPAPGRRSDARPRLPTAHRAGRGLQRRRGPSRRLPRDAAVPGRRPRRADAAGGRVASRQHAGALGVGHARAPQARRLPERRGPAGHRTAGGRFGAPAVARTAAGDTRRAPGLRPATGTDRVILATVTACWDFRSGRSPAAWSRSWRPDRRLRSISRRSHRHAGTDAGRAPCPARSRQPITAS